MRAAFTSETVRKFVDLPPILELVQYNGSELRRAPNDGNFWEDVFPACGPDASDLSLSYGDWETVSPDTLARLEGRPRMVSAPYPGGYSGPIGAELDASDRARLLYACDLLSFSDYSGSSCERANVKRLREDFSAAGFVLTAHGGHGTTAILIPAAVLMRTACGACNGGPRTMAETLASLERARAARAAGTLGADSLDGLETGTGARDRADVQAADPCERCALAEELRETLRGLERYPVISDDDLSETENELEADAWENYGRSDFETAVRKRFPCDPAARGPRAEYESEFAVPGGDHEPGAFDWHSLFLLGAERANVYPEHETGGGVYFDVDRAAAELEWADLEERGARFPAPRPVDRSEVRRARAKFNRARRAETRFRRTVSRRGPDGTRALRGPARELGAKTYRPLGCENWAAELRLSRARSRAGRWIAALEARALRSFTAD